MKAQLSSQEWMLLSAYIDGKLSPREVKTLEEKLRLSEPLRHALEDLRYTHILLHDLPRKRAPRSFALKPEMLPNRRSWFPWAPAFGLSSALAGILTVLTFALNFIQPVMPMAMAPASAGLQQYEAPAVVAPEATAPIIVWKNEVSPTTSAVEGGIGGGAAETPYSEMTIRVVSTPAPSYQDGNATEAPAPTGEVGNPILGLTTPDTEKMIPEESQPIAPRDEYQPEQTNRFLLPIILAVITLLSGAAAVILRRKGAV